MRCGLSYSSKYYPDDDHGSVPLITEYDGLRCISSAGTVCVSHLLISTNRHRRGRQDQKHGHHRFREMGYNRPAPRWT